MRFLLSFEKIKVRPNFVTSIFLMLDTLTVCGLKISIETIFSWSPSPMMKKRCKPNPNNSKKTTNSTKKYFLDALAVHPNFQGEVELMDAFTELDYFEAYKDEKIPKGLKP